MYRLSPLFPSLCLTLSDKVANQFGYFAKIVANLTLPKSKRIPPELGSDCRCCQVAGAIALKLSGPELCVWTTGYPPSVLRTAVPETAIDEDNNLRPWQREVGGEARA